MGRFQRVAAFDQVPRIFLKLLHAQADTVGVLVDLDDLHLDGFANGQNFLGVVHTAPCHVGDVQQAVNATQIDECAVFGDVLDDAVNHVAFGQLADHFGALLGAGFFEDRTTRYNDVATATVHFQDLERLLEVHQRASVTHGAHIDLRTGQEGHGAAEVDSEAALDATEDGAFDALFVGICFFQTIPGGLAAGHFAADDSLATGVLDCAQENLDLIADSDFGGFTGICEFFQINAAFHLVADVDDGLARFNRDHLAFDNRPFFGRVDFEAFIQKGFEVLHRYVLSHVASFSFSGCFWPCGCLRRSCVMSAFGGTGWSLRSFLKRMRAGGKPDPARMKR